MHGLQAYYKMGLPNASYQCRQVEASMLLLLLWPTNEICLLVCDTGLLRKLMSKGVVFSWLFFSILVCVVMQAYGEDTPQTAPMLCQNQNRNFCCFIDRQQHDSEKLPSLITEKGVMGGRKAYFKAYVDQTVQQLVVVPAMLPGQDW